MQRAGGVWRADQGHLVSSALSGAPVTAGLKKNNKTLKGRCVGIERAP